LAVCKVPRLDHAVCGDLCVPLRRVHLGCYAMCCANFGHQGDRDEDRDVV